MERADNNNFFGTVFKGVGISIVFTIICLTIFALLLAYTNMSESLIQPVVIGVTGISILLGSCISNRKMTKNGILNGVIIGFLYIMIIYLISSFINNMDFSLNVGSIIMMVIGIVGGAIGGIIGVNIK